MPTNSAALVVAGLALGFLLLAAVVALLQRRNWKEILGYDKRLLWSYRDTLLSFVASIATLWAVVLLAFGDGGFDSRVGLVAILVVAVCAVLTPNWHVIIGTALGFAAFQGWFAVAFSGDSRSLWVAIPATVAEIGFLLLVRNRPVWTGNARREV